MRNNIILGIIISIGITGMIILPRLILGRNEAYIDSMVINTFIMLFLTWFGHLWLIGNRGYNQLISNIWIRNITSIVVVTIVVYAVLQVLLAIFDTPQINKQYFYLERHLRVYNFSRILVWNIIYQWILFSQKMIEESKNAQLETSKAAQLALETKITSLKEQLSPHFMFNSLNTLSSMTNDKAVQSFVSKLADVYRYLLIIKEQKVVSVKEELAFTKAYWYILKERFEEAIELQVKFLTDPAELLIPPMTLQSLVENAIKHNKATKRNSLTITIYEDGENIVVSNNLQPKIKMLESTGVGLYNLSERYKLLFYKEITISCTDQFIVKLPIVKR